MFVEDGRIVSIQSLGARPADAIDLGAAILLPGLVDTHVHVNEPGRSDWEGFASATRAAAAGGVTTLLDMPLNAVPATTTAAALMAKRNAALGNVHVDVGFIGGVVPGNHADLEALGAAGIFAWKCFLVDSGAPEFPHIDEAGLRRVLRDLARLKLPLMVHAELPQPIAAAVREDVVRNYAVYAATRPLAAETGAVALMIRLAEEYGARVHIVHVSSGEAAHMIAAARARGIPISAETCPHYLTFAAEEIPDAATAFKCAPPIRERTQREALWEALRTHALQMIVSDHSPSPLSRKALDTGDFISAWGGIASLQVGLSAVWTGASARGMSIDRVAQWMATAPADLVRLPHKGRIAVGSDADFVMFDPHVSWPVDAAQLYHRHPISAFHGLTLAGRVRATYLRGALIYDGRGFPAEPSGRLLHRDEV